MHTIEGFLDSSFSYSAFGPINVILFNEVPYGGIFSRVRSIVAKETFDSGISSYKGE